MAELLRTNPLSLLEASMAAASWPGTTLTPIPFLAQVGVRGRLERLTPAEPLPPANRVERLGASHLLGLGPDEWLAVGPDGIEAELVDRLRAVIRSEGGAVVDLSAARTGVLLAGPAARLVLSTCCALDFHPTRFGPGHCARTLIAKVPVIIEQLDDEPAYRILVGPSFAAYVVGWLVDGMLGVRAAADR